jgi:hypothetical protein
MDPAIARSTVVAPSAEHAVVDVVSLHRARASGRSLIGESADSCRRPGSGPAGGQLTVSVLGLAVALLAITAAIAGCAIPIDPTIGVTTAPISSAVSIESGTFEGHPTYSSMPAHPVGVVYLFHGSGGSASFALKVETTDVLNTLTARGYGFVATDSTERTGDKQWDVDHATTATNLDVQRLERLHDHIVATTCAQATTPLFGIGMSNGSSFVTIWSEALKRDGYPVRAQAKYMAGVPIVVKANGGVTVPTQMVVAVNDTTTNPGKERRDLADIQAAGVPGRLDEVQERAVVAARYLRIPGIDQATADAVVEAIRTAGVIDSTGHRIIAVADLQARLIAVALPASVPAGLRNDIGNETFAMLAMHQFNAEFKTQTADWFDTHRT